MTNLSSMKLFSLMRRNQRHTKRHTHGFTLIELLVVIAIIAILSAVLLPVLNRAKARAQGAYCMNNTHEIMLGWIMYADDNGQILPANDYPVAGGPSPDYRSWVADSMTNPNESTNIGLLNNKYTVDGVSFQDTVLTPYQPNPTAYKCPADPSTQQWLGAGYSNTPRVRSYSMNCAVGTIFNSPSAGHSIGSPVLGSWLAGPPGTGAQASWQTYGKLTSIRSPDPSDLWTLIDENPDGINDPVFAVDCAGTGSSAGLVDHPAWFHNGCAGMSYADGHSEIHQWLDGRTELQITGKTLGNEPGFVSSPNNADVAWLQQHTSAPTE